jgi:hypothetical protein
VVLLAEQWFGRLVQPIRKKLFGVLQKTGTDEAIRARLLEKTSMRFPRFQEESCPGNSTLK